MNSVMVIYVVRMVMNYNFGWYPLFVVFIYHVYLSYEKTCISFTMLSWMSVYTSKINTFLF
jgi:hypothetical protein